MKKLSFIAFALIISGIINAQEPFSGSQCITLREFIYQPDDVPFPSCHASTIEEIKGGLIAAWFGGTEERNPDVGIWTSRFIKGKWSKPEEPANGLRDGKRYPCWNPVLFNPGDELLLFFKVGPSPSEWWGELMVSADDGISWTAPRRLPDGIMGPVKNKPVLLGNGTLLCPSSSEHDGWRVHMEMTPDFGMTWSMTEALNDKTISAIQPSVLIHPGKKLQIVCRSKQSKILSSWSEDEGRTWSPLSPLNLPNPNSGIDAVTLSDGRHFMVYNHLKSGRHMLNTAISDDGINWKPVALLENETKGSEFSYPAVIQSDDGMIHITYTWNRKLIRHVVIDPTLMEAGEFTAETGWPAVTEAR